MLDSQIKVEHAKRAKDNCAISFFNFWLLLKNNIFVITIITTFIFNLLSHNRANNLLGAQTPLEYLGGKVTLPCAYELQRIKARPLSSPGVATVRHHRTAG